MSSLSTHSWHASFMDSSEIPQLEDLQRQTRRESLMDWAVILVAIGLLIFLFDKLVIRGDPTARLFTAISLIAAIFVHNRTLIELFAKKKVRVRNLKDTSKVGPYTGRQIRDLASELFWPHRSREMPAIFITQTKSENAYVLDSLLFNFVRPLNAVYISEHIFNLLDLDEIKAILSHELGHFYHYMRPLNRVRFIITLLNATLPIYLSLLLFGALNAGAFIVWVVFTAFFLRTVNRWFLRVSRSHEYLCDYHAAKRFGVLSFINGLIKIAKHSEMIALLQETALKRVSEDPRLTLKQFKKVFEQVEECLPTQAAPPEQLKLIVDTVFASETLPRLEKPMTRKQLEEERERVDAFIESFLDRAKFEMIDWKTFDTEDEDGVISAAEFPMLIKALQKNPEGQLFQIMEDHAGFASQGSHPTVRQRILFLHKCGLPLEVT